jgi:thioredoxin 1
MIAPALDAIAEKYQDRVRVVKMNIDENPRTPAKYNLRSIPTLLWFHRGTVAGQHVGALSAAQLESFIDKRLDTANSERA